MAYTQSDLIALDRAIKSGRSKVRYGDKEVTYRSLDEMLRARDFIQGEIAASSGRRERVSFASFERD